MNAFNQFLAIFSSDLACRLISPGSAKTTLSDLAARLPNEFASRRFFVQHHEQTFGDNTKRSFAESGDVHRSEADGNHEWTRLRQAATA